MGKRFIILSALALLAAGASAQPQDTLKYRNKFEGQGCHHLFAGTSGTVPFTESH